MIDLFIYSTAPWSAPLQEETKFLSVEMTRNHYLSNTNQVQLSKNLKVNKNGFALFKIKPVMFVMQKPWLVLKLNK